MRVRAVGARRTGEESSEQARVTGSAVGAGRTDEESSEQARATGRRCISLLWWHVLLAALIAWLKCGARALALAVRRSKQCLLQWKVYLFRSVIDSKFLRSAM